jgi:hypothetical protein
MKRAWRWTRRIALGVIGFAVLAVAITLGTLHTNWGRNRVRAIAEEQLQSAFPGSTIRRIDGSVLGDLIARDVTIMGRDKRPLVTIETLTLHAALLPLVGKTARVERIEADGVVVYARSQPEADPKPEPEPTPETPSEPSAWSIEMPTIQVTRGRVEIETATGVEHIADLGAGVSLSMRSGEPLIASVHATASWRKQPISIAALVANDDRLDVRYASLSLGDARVNVVDAHVDGTKISGGVIARVPAALVKQVADVELPGDAALLARISPTGQLQVTGTMGAAHLDAYAATDLEKLTARAIVAANVPDVAALSDGAVTGSGTVVATVVADPEHVDGIVTITGDAQGNAGSALVALGATLTRARVVIAAMSDRSSAQDVAGWHLGGAMSLSQTNGNWSLDESRFDADAATAFGAASATLEARGPLTPEPSLKVTGVVDGRDVRYDDLSIARVQTRIAATNVPARPEGNAQIEVSGVKQGATSLALATLGVRGVMNEDGTIDVDFDRHLVRAASGMTWTGTGGHVRVTDTSIAVTRISTTSGKSQITAQATIGRTTDALAAKVTARDVAVALFDPTLGGTLAADLDVRRQGGTWKGTATVDANQIVVPDRPIIDGKLAINIDKRRITAKATASNPAIGGATLELDVLGPRDITDGLAWQRLERSSIQSVRIALSKIDASKLGASGSLDGELAIFAAGAGGKVEMRGVETTVGRLDSQLALGAAARGEIAAHGTLHLGGVDPVDVHATLALPIHPFDPAGWSQLGRATLRDATIEAKRIAFDPVLMKRFGVESPWRGWASVKLHIGAGARTSDFTIAVNDLRDGPLTKPVHLEFTGGSDASGVHADANVRSDNLAFGFTAKSPLTVEAILAGRARSAQVAATLTVPTSSARELALLVGRKDVLGGTLGGKVEVSGTIEQPIGRAQLVVDNLSVAAGLTRKPPTLEKLEIDARWLGMATGFELDLVGHETGGRLLKIAARGKPDALDSVVASIEASNFDITPFLAFAPPDHPATGMRGLVSGVLKLRGLDPQTGDVRGRLVVNEARIPLSPELGTFRSGTFEINVIKKEIVATIDGKIGRGTVKGKAIARLTGSMPTAAELTLALRQVSPIGEIQPVIDADISGWFAKTRTKWTGKIAVKKGKVFVPPDGGNELLVTGTPGDIVFIDAQKIIVKPKRRPPTAPWLFATIDIEPTKILVDNTDFSFEGTASGQLELTVGDGIGLDGAISTESGKVDVLGRRYQLDHGVVDFDGSLDPRLDIRMMHDFRSLTLTVDIRGRSSEPDLRLSSDSGAYSQSQLLSFLAGATPSDDPASQSGDAVASGSLAIISSRIGKSLNKRVPLIKFDTINYEAKTASSSRAIKLGKRFAGGRGYLSYRQRFEPRPDENPSEGVIEYELRKDILVEGAGGGRGAGADLLWRKRW